MMTVKAAINGFGRIGRCVLRRIIEKGAAFDLCAINDITSAETLAYLLKYDSVHGTLKADVKASGNTLVVNGKEIPVLAERDPASLPWKKMGVGLVLECSGIFRDREKAGKHIEAGARKVLISAPAKGEDKTLVYGVNHETYDPGKHHIISNASCTTNCLAPMVKVLLDTAGIVSAQMTTIHSYTNDQRILDLPHKDLRRARAAALSMIPTTTGAAKAIALIIPELEGKIDGMAIRVPTSNVSIIELTAETKKKTDAATLNEAYRKAAGGALKGIMNYTEEPVVSIDFNGTEISCTMDGPLTKVMEGNNAKVFGWYDNEYGYSCRMVDVANMICEKGF
jgi:glyceraldehyde 3-phosphate dehydrogenase